MRACVRLDARVMGRVCVRVLHKLCLIHFDLLVCQQGSSSDSLFFWYQVVSMTLLCTSSVFDHSVSLLSPNVHWMQLVLYAKQASPSSSTFFI